VNRPVIGTTAPRQGQWLLLVVNCDDSWAINDAADDFLDNVLGVQVTGKWGGIASIHDFSGTNEFFAFVAVTFVGIDPINFAYASEFVSTNARCGIVEPIIDNLRDVPEA
jgi:hypothetical protein